MISLEPTVDVTYLDQILHDPRIIQHMADDSTPHPENVSMAPAMVQLNSLFLKVLVDGQPGGWFWFYEKPNDRTVLEAHTALLPECRGSRALQAGHQAVDYIFKTYSGCTAISTFAWTDDPASIWYAFRMNFVKTGQERYPHTRKGQPVDIIHFLYPRERWGATRN